MERAPAAPLFHLAHLRPKNNDNVARQSIFHFGLMSVRCLTCGKETIPGRPHLSQSGDAPIVAAPGPEAQNGT